MQRDMSMSKTSGKRSIPLSVSPGRIEMQSVGQANSHRPHATQLGLAVVQRDEHRVAAEGVGVVEPLFRVLDHEGALLADDVAPEVPEEVAGGDGEADEDHRQVEPLRPSETPRR